ncbi:hypothetical protein BH10BAC6_BH10BAC6_05880 [soil metagenome]
MEHSEQERTATAHRFFAVECNNEAWRLAELPTRTPAETESLLHNAHASAYHWSHIGTEAHTVKAWALLAQAHALAGNGRLASHYAQQHLAAITSQASADWEVAFAFIIMANTAHASGNLEEHADYYAKAEAHGNVIADPQDKAIFLRTFLTAPTP